MGRRLFGNKVSFSATFRKHPTFLKETYPDVDASAIGNTIPLQFNLRTARRSLGSWEFFSIHPCQSMGYCGRHGGPRDCQREYFRTKIVQWIGLWGLFGPCGSS